ncbi:C-type lectin mannose-binding isoform-like, partial [Saccostrea cucullata]|uniref:C-type lectin mannose-binding isoform-like n=1 Tax=Saccostrea cuccullata TaxID=36930 RepID=UPI002ED3439D
TACRKAGADVLEFHNPLEEKWIDLQCRLRGYAGVWIGISDLQQEGHFISVSEARPPRYLKWARGEPTNSGSNEHCAYYYYTWRGLVDVRCSNKYNVVCKK